MKDSIIKVRDWADKRAIVVERMCETSEEIKILIEGMFHYEDACALNRLIEGWHLAFIDAENNSQIELTLNKDHIQ